MSTLYSILTSNLNITVTVTQGFNVSEKGSSGYYRSHPTYQTTFSIINNDDKNHKIIHQSQHRFEVFVNLETYIKKSSLKLINEFPLRTNKSRFGLSKQNILKRSECLNLWLKEVLSTINQISGNWNESLINEFNNIFKLNISDSIKDVKFIKNELNNVNSMNSNSLFSDLSQFNKEHYMISYDCLKFDEKIDSSGKGQIFRGTFHEKSGLRLGQSKRVVIKSIFIKVSDHIETSYYLLFCCLFCMPFLLIHKMLIIVLITRVLRLHVVILSWSY